MSIDSCTDKHESDPHSHLQTNVDVMFLTETSLNDFQARRCQESGSVLCIQGPFVKKEKKAQVGLFPLYAWLFCEWGDVFSVLSAFKVKVTNVLSVQWL